MGHDRARAAWQPTEHGGQAWRGATASGSPARCRTTSRSPSPRSCATAPGSTADSECVTWRATAPGAPPIAEIAANAERLAAALTRLGVGAGDRVGTFCWNNQEHLEAYFAVPCMGAVAAHAEHPAARRAARAHHQPRRGQGHHRRRHAAAAAGRGRRRADDGRGLHRDRRRRRLGARGDTPGAPLRRRCSPPRSRGFDWPELDETLGRGDVLHQRHHRRPEGRRLLAPLDLPARAGHAVGNAVHRLPARPTGILTIVPMFHVNAWGIPFGCVPVRRDPAHAGPYMTPGPICDFIEAERSTAAPRPCRPSGAGSCRYGGRARDRPVVAAAGHLGRRGDAALADGGVREAATACASSRAGA